MWEALDAGESERIAIHREQLMRDLERLRAARDPLKALALTPAGEIRVQHLSGLELALFGARLPQPPEGEYRVHGE